MTQFVYQNRIHHAKGFAPSTSLLQYIRLDLVQTGTKEGCAAGDCGACTVVVGEKQNHTIVYSAINACITPLGSLHGKQLITIEDLATEHFALSNTTAGADESEALHPVQKAMIECHGSQCGFCTPGIVMSLYAWWLKVKGNQLPANRHTVEQALSGNLCRCTGYQPILRAALKSLCYSYDERKLEQQLSKIKTLLDEIDQVSLHDASPRIIPSNTEASFLRPTNCQELAHCLSLYPSAQLVAGATDLGLEFTQKLATPSILIYTRDIAELNQLEDRADSLLIGAGVTYTAMHVLIQQYFPDFAALLERLGSLQIRNQGTLGGNIANASPIGDTPPVLLALNAELTAISSEGERTLPIDGFFTGYRKTQLKANEALQSITLPKLKPSEYLKVYKISKRFDDDISAICLAIWIKFDRERESMIQDAALSGDAKDTPIITDIRIGFGGMAATPMRAYHTERALLNSPFDSTAVSAASDAIFEDFSPIDDVRATAKYRLAMAGSLLERCRQELFGLSSPPPWDMTTHSDHPILDTTDTLSNTLQSQFYEISAHSGRGSI